MSAFSQFRPKSLAFLRGLKRNNDKTWFEAHRAEYDAARKDKSGRGRGRLTALQKRLADLRVMDPACGCGNFLVITYRELRRLELKDGKLVTQEVIFKSIGRIRHVIAGYPGQTPVLIHFQNSSGKRATVELPELYHVKRSDELLQALDKWIDD